MWVFSTMRETRVRCAYALPPQASLHRGGRGTGRGVCGLRTAAATAAAALALAVPALLPAPVHSAIINEQACIAGSGAGCNAATEGNELIRSLQAKSHENREKNEAAVKDRYWKEGYGSYFKFATGKELRKDPETGEWSLVRPDDGLSKAIQRAGILPDLDRK